MFPSHFVTARTDEILARVPALRPHADEMAGRAMLVRRTAPVPFECVVRGYLSGSAWAEYRERGTLAGEPLPAGLLESERLEPPLFSPATKAEIGPRPQRHLRRRGRRRWARELAGRLRDASFAVYRAGRDHAAARGIIIADTKFEFGTDAGGTLRLIDEVMTPDSSRFWPADRYSAGAGPAELRQAAAARLSRRAQARGPAGTARRRRRRCPPRWSRRRARATSRRIRLLTGRALADSA